MSFTRERRWWTSQEDEILRNQVQIQLFNDGNVQNWSVIALLLPGRTNKDCRKRWSKLQHDIRKGAWTRDEDESLQQAVQQHGLKWSQVATVVQSRNADQCAKRWQHVSGPDFKHTPWTPVEDRKLLEARKRYGNNWKQIGLTELPDRSTHNIRNRYRSLVLSRRSRARGTFSDQQPNQISNKNEANEVNGEKGENDDYNYDDNDEGENAADENPGFDHPGSRAILHHAQGHPRTQHIDLQSMTHFQQSHAPFFGATVGQVWTYQELPTPESDCPSWLNPIEVSPSAATLTPYPWLTEGPMDDGLCFDDSAACMGTRLLDTPGSSDESRGKGYTESSADGGTYRHYEDAVHENEKKGSVTLTLSQVEPDVAQEIMASVLKHSGDLKIRCVVNDD